MFSRLKLLSLVSLFLAVLVAGAFDARPTEAAPPIPLRFMYYVGGKSYDALVANAANIDIISPDFYRLQDDGTIRGYNHTEVTSFARSKGIKVVPMIQNDPDKDNFNKLLSDPAKFKNILDTIEGQVVANNYDGYQVDFEDLNLASEPLLTNFMRELAGRLRPKGKLVTMAVVSRTSSLPTSQFSAAYNYAALAPSLDLVTVMTYDYAWAGGEPGPVAPVNWQEKVMNYAAPLFGPGKVLLGVPFYGYDWNITERVNNKSLRAVSHTFDETLQLQRENKGTFGYDWGAQTPYLEYVKDGDQHKVYFENAQSISAKFDMMKRLGLRGFAAWRLGHDGAEFWPVIKNLILPTKPVPNPGPNTSYRIYFPQTGHTLQGTFKKYWDKFGGLPQFGYPWTEEFQEPSPSEAGKNFTVQYYERNRFEYHPEFAGTQYEVLLGLLGRQVTAGRENEPPFRPIVGNASTKGLSDPLARLLPWASSQNVPALAPEVDLFPQTGHTLRGAFRNYWLKNGGLFIYGYPISEEFQELNPADGKVYTIQYFERNRFEYHPEFAGTKNEVLLGLLGNQIMALKGWL